jgi:type IV fimbrial biogenesis protein FimT
VRRAHVETLAATCGVSPVQASPTGFPVGEPFAFGGRPAGRTVSAVLCGFTLIEIIVALGVVGLLTTVAVPRLTEFLASQQVKSGALDFQTALVFARSEAIKRNAAVTIAALQADLAGGWEIAQGATVLRRQAAIPNVTLSGPSTTVTFDGDGRLSGSGRLIYQVSSVTSDAVTKRCVVLDLSGRAAIRSDRNSDGNCLNG